MHYEVKLLYCTTCVLSIPGITQYLTVGKPHLKSNVGANVPKLYQVLFFSTLVAVTVFLMMCQMVP